MQEKSLRLIADRFKVLSDPLRLALLHRLKEGERTVSTLVEETGASQANVSKHLSVLKRAGLVDCRREGLNVFYRIIDEGVFTICRNVCDSLELRIDREHQTIIEGKQQIQQAEGRQT